MSALDNSERVTHLMESHTLPILRTASLSVFLDQLYSKVGEQKSLNKDQLKTLLAECSDSFSKDFKVKLLLTAEAELKAVEDEYETLCVEHKKL